MNTNIFIKIHSIAGIRKEKFFSLVVIKVAHKEHFVGGVYLRRYEKVNIGGIETILTIQTAFKLLFDFCLSKSVRSKIVCLDKVLF